MDRETTGQFVARIGMTWEEWTALPSSERARIAAEGAGVTVKDPDALRIMDLPVEDRLAAFRASLGA